MNKIFDVPEPIRSFKGRHSFLSNFYPAVVTWEGRVWPTVEHAYQATKTEDENEREWVDACETAGQAKRMGENLTLRDGWDEMKVDVMRDLLQLKFQAEPVRSWLLDTGTAQLIEDNSWGDTFWGVCRGKGENHLGRLLMEVRQGLRAR
tara:strand:- start:22188 stop:22634 length:447 start_codon:yes stop_codon:yes gene_type:complete